MNISTIWAFLAGCFIGGNVSFIITWLIIASSNEERRGNK